MIFIRLDVLLTEIVSLVSNLPIDIVKQVNQEKIENLLYHIALKFISKDVYEDGISLKSKYKDTSYLSTLESKDFLQERNKLLMAFICGSSNIEFENQTTAPFLYAMAVAVEMIYFLRNLNLILPHCFMLNLIQSFTSGSKTVSKVNGKVTPGASYSTYKNWINAKGKNPILCPSGDLIIFFDNMGKYIVKHYKILSSKKESADITTATLHFVFHDSNLQPEEKLMPGVWRKQDSVENIQAKMKIMWQSAINSFRTYRIVFIEKILERIARDNQDVEKLIEKKQSVKRICSNVMCGTLYSSLKRKCNNCGAKVIIRSNEEIHFISAEEHVTAKSNRMRGEEIKNKAILKVGEPIMINPNSYANVKVVLDNLITQALNDDRKWIILGCDGPPYCIASRIIDSTQRSVVV